jgi:hypothetical protein
MWITRGIQGSCWYLAMVLEVKCRVNAGRRMSGRSGLRFRIHVAVSGMKDRATS